jgi:transcriptional regulator with XRE-family HTH domain
MDFGDKIKDLREQRGYMQSHVAEMLGIAPNTLSGYENNNRKPNSATVKKLAEYYGVTIDYLLGSESSINDLEEDFPEGVMVLRRASKELTPEARAQMIKLMKAFLEKD